MKNKAFPSFFISIFSAIFLLLSSCNMKEIPLPSPAGNKSDTSYVTESQQIRSNVDSVDSPESENSVENSVFSASYPSSNCDLMDSCNTVKTEFFSYVELNAFTGSQGGLKYGNLVFRFSLDNTFRVFDFSTGNPYGSFVLNPDLNGKDYAPHCNMACIGKVFFAHGDPLPLIYVNAYNNPNLPLATLYAFRITYNERWEFSSSLVQTIQVGFVDSDLWSVPNNKRPHGNFVIDTDRDLLYAYLPRPDLYKTRFFAFPLPSLEQGETVELKMDDILEVFDANLQIVTPQDNCYHDGKIYICSGASTANYIRIFDLEKKQFTENYNLFELAGLCFEPQCIDVDGESVFCGGENLIKFNFY